MVNGRLCVDGSFCHCVPCILYRFKLDGFEVDFTSGDMVMKQEMRAAPIRVKQFHNIPMKLKYALRRKILIK